MSTVYKTNQLSNSFSGNHFMAIGIEYILIRPSRTSYKKILDWILNPDKLRWLMSDRDKWMRSAVTKLVPDFICIDLGRVGRHGTTPRVE